VAWQEQIAQTVGHEPRIRRDFYIQEHRAYFGQVPASTLFV
jgi:hypothetical protein